jgi:hypothetical protein
MVELNKKFRASSVLESVFAMIIIMICFTMAMIVFNTLSISTRGIISVKARMDLQSEATRCKLNDELMDGRIVRDDYMIERRLIYHAEFPDLMELSLIAKNHNGITLAEHHEYLEVNR